MTTAQMTANQPKAMSAITLSSSYGSARGRPLSRGGMRKRPRNPAGHLRFGAGLFFGGGFFSGSSPILSKPT